MYFYASTISEYFISFFRLTWRCFTICKDGIRVDFFHSKVKTHEKPGCFIIPKKTNNEDGPCLFTIVSDYMTNARKYWPELWNELDRDFFIQGLPTVTKNGKPRKTGYAHIPLGLQMMYGIGVEVARYLGLENPEGYTGMLLKISQKSFPLKVDSNKRFVPNDNRFLIKKLYF